MEPCAKPEPVREFIPYGRQSVDADDLAAVAAVLQSDWLTTGPLVEKFEYEFSKWTGAVHSVAVSSGTAALHAAVFAAGIGPGDEVIVPAITFAATANSVEYQGGKAVFADVDPDTLLIDPEDAERRITPRTKAIITVDFAGQPCDYSAFFSLARKRGLTFIADACHSLGAEYKGKKTGTLADLTAFSFHPVKHITTGEGGMISTGSSELAARMRRFRNHGISTDHRQRTGRKMWEYEMTELGYNYRITDFQCALGVSQLKKLNSWLVRRNEIARFYHASFSGSPIMPLELLPEIRHAYHLYVLRLGPDIGKADRREVFLRLHEMGIGANVHYIPLHYHPYYRDKYGLKRGDYPAAEAAYERILSIPIFPGMSDEDCGSVVDAVFRATDLARSGRRPCWKK